jgi:hypothetical protein
MTKFLYVPFVHIHFLPLMSPCHKHRPVTFPGLATFMQRLVRPVSLLCENVPVLKKQTFQHTCPYSELLCRFIDNSYAVLLQFKIELKFLTTLITRNETLHAFRICCVTNISVYFCVLLYFELIPMLTFPPTQRRTHRHVTTVNIIVFSEILKLVSSLKCCIAYTVIFNVTVTGWYRTNRPMHCEHYWSIVYYPSEF